MSGKTSHPNTRGLLADLMDAAGDRLEDAEALLKSGRYASAIAFGIYALEIELKVVICRRLEPTELPKVFETHDLDTLMMHLGLSVKVRRVKRPRFIAKNWDELIEIGKGVDQFRYKNNPAWDERLGKRVLQLLRDEPNGVLPWLQKQASIKRR